MSGWLRPARRLASVLARFVLVALGVGFATSLPMLVLLPFLFSRNVGPGAGVLAIAILTTTWFICCLFLVGRPLHRRLLDEHNFLCLKCDQRTARFRMIGRVVDGPDGWTDHFELRCGRCEHVDVTT